MDGFMDIGHQKGGQEGKEKGEVRKGEERVGCGTPRCLVYYFTGHQEALSK